MKQTEGTCPHCGKKLANYDHRDWKYGSLVRKCKKCGKQYIDKRYHEMAIEGIGPDAMSVKKCVFGLIFGLVLVLVTILVISRAFHSHSSFSVLWIGIGVMGLLAAGYMLFDLIRILSGWKERTYNTLRLESEERLKDKEYVYLLLSVGYMVPSRYM